MADNSKIHPNIALLNREFKNIFGSIGKDLEIDEMGGDGFEIKGSGRYTLSFANVGTDENPSYNLTILKWTYFPGSYWEPPDADYAEVESFPQERALDALKKMLLLNFEEDLDNCLECFGEEQYSKIEGLEPEGGTESRWNYILCSGDSGWKCLEERNDDER